MYVAKVSRVKSVLGSYHMIQRESRPAALIVVLVVLGSVSRKTGRDLSF